MNSRPPGWYLQKPDDKYVTYWNGREFTNDITGTFGKSFPVFDPNYVAPKQKVRWQDAKLTDKTPLARAGRISLVFVLCMFAFAGCTIILVSSLPDKRDESVEAVPTYAQTSEPTPTAEAVAEAPPPPVYVAPPEPVGKDYYENCTDVWNTIHRPIHSDDSGYDGNLDRDGDGTGCEEDPR